MKSSTENVIVTRDAGGEPIAATLIVGGQPILFIVDRAKLEQIQELLNQSL